MDVGVACFSHKADDSTRLKGSCHLGPKPHYSDGVWPGLNGELTLLIFLKFEVENVHGLLGLFASISKKHGGLGFYRFGTAKLDFILLLALSFSRTDVLYLIF